MNTKELTEESGKWRIPPMRKKASVMTIVSLGLVL